MKIDLLKPIVKTKAQELIAECAKKGIELAIISTLRTFAEQDALYAQGRTVPGQIVTNAKGGQSFHNYGVAFDVVQIIGGKYCWTADMTPIGLIAESLGLEWGDRGYVDPPHFQYRAGYSLQDFQSGNIDESKFQIQDNLSDRAKKLLLIQKLILLVQLLKKLKPF